MVNQRTLGRTGLAVSEVGLGALELGRNWRSWDSTGDRWRPDEAGAAELLHTALDNGCNFIDTAAAYHRSEERIGAALETRRDEYVLATKFGEWCYEKEDGSDWSEYDYSAEAARKFLAESLRKLRTDTIDLWQIHSGSPEQVEDKELLGALQEAKAAGTVRYLGLSCGEDGAIAAIESGVFDTIQISYSLLDQHMESRVLPLALAHGVGVIIKDPLAGGRLVAAPESFPAEHREWHVGIQDRLRAILPDGMTLAELALRFVLSHPAVSTVIAGTRKSAHLLANLRAADGQGLPADLLEKARESVAG